MTSVGAGAGAAAAAGTRPAPAPPGRAARALVPAALLLLAFAFQGSRPLADPDEGRYAEAARGMLAARDPLLPRLDGRPHLTKPPGTYLAVAAGLGTLGINPWGARAAGACAFLAWLLAARALGRTLAGGDARRGTGPRSRSGPRCCRSSAARS